MRALLHNRLSILLSLSSFGLIAILLSSFFTSSVLAKEKPRQWQKGMLLDVSSRDASRLVDGTSYDRLFWTYTIDDGHLVWKLQRDTRRHDKPLDVTINSTVEFAIEGQKAYMKDEEGQEHSLSVQSKALKTPATP